MPDQVLQETIYQMSQQIQKLQDTIRHLTAEIAEMKLSYHMEIADLEHRLTLLEVE